MRTTCVRRLLFVAVSCASLGLPSVAHAQAAACGPASGFVGTVCTPRAGGKHPAILVLGGSGGGDRLARVAARFAPWGFVAASVAYFGLPTLPPTLDAIPVETVGRALGVVMQRPDVDAAHVGIFGDSKGGELAFLAATVYPAIRAVVAVVPSPFAWETRRGTSSWTVGGQAVPFVPLDLPLRRVNLDSRQVYDLALQRHRAAVATAMFHLESIGGPVLCLAADDDRVWDSPYQCESAMAYLHARGHAYADQYLHFADAGHGFLFATASNGEAQFGGSARGNRDAAASAWRAIDAFPRAALPAAS